MRRTLQFAMALWCALTSGAAERIAHCRTFPAGELPIVSVTLGPRGRIVACQGDGAALTILDGYSTRQVNLPPDVSRPFRVFESRTGQLWTTYGEGLLMYKGGQWNRYFINDIRIEPLKPFHPVPIVPAEVNRALFLLPGRLMDFDASIPRLSTIKLASDTRLGPLIEMSESSDGGLMISGSNGIARVTGPLRQVGPNSIWQQCLLATNSSVENLQRPFEGREGATVIVGFDRTNSSIRHILTAVGTNWITDEKATEKLRLAWHGWGDTHWGMSYNGLYRHAGQGLDTWVREGGADTYYDVA